jgi:hypothetical protein
MRFAAAVLLVCALTLPAAEQATAFFPVAVDYPLSTGTPPSTIASDLQAIRAAGFNAIEVTLTWRDGEPVRGAYAVESIGRVLAQAGQAELRVILAVDDTPPGWLFERYADAARQTATGRSTDACFDHPGVRADETAFVKAIATEASRHKALLAIDVGSRKPAGLCLCPYTKRRMNSLTAMYARDDHARARIMRRLDLGDLAAAAASARADTASRTSVPSLLSDPRAFGQDDWLMAGLVDRYGVTLNARSAIGMATDDLAGAARGRSWWVEVDASVPDADRRLATWTAISRGAQGVIFDDPPRDLTFLQAIARNPVLFTQLRPRRAQVALLFDPLMPTAKPDLLAAAHQALYGRQIAADIFNVEQLAAADLRGYRAIVATSSRALPAWAREAVAAARGSGAAFVDAARGGRVLDAIVPTGVSPEVRIDGGSDIEVRFLESPTVQMIVALNHASQSQRVTMTFAPDTQEAIWVNMETGTGVNFVAGPAGPSHHYWFRPKDALVLMIRKDIR